MPATQHDSGIADIARKVESGERLSHDDGVRLFATRDIHELGRLADLVRRRLHGDAAFYNVNRHINYTNYCVLRCKFCSFYRPYAARVELQSNHTEPAHVEPGLRQSRKIEVDAPVTGPTRPGSETSSAISLPLMNIASAIESASGDDGATGGGGAFGDDDTYELSIDQMVERAREAVAGGATEVHIVGGLHPKLPFEYYVDMCLAIRAACPDLFIKAFTAIEIIHFTRIARPRLSIREVLERLRDAGLDTLPGGGAEIFDDRVHGEAYRAKVGEAGWFDVHRTAHELGIPTNATMLYGHIERPVERVTHMVKLRAHQDESICSRGASFNCFIPLSFIPEGSEFAHLPGPTGLDDLRTLAVSRLMLDNIPHLKAFWIMQSAKLSQVSLSWGVDDIDGTVVFYDITKREGGAGNRHQEMTVSRIRRLMREAGFRPVERDSLYREIRRPQTDAVGAR